MIVYQIGRFFAHSIRLKKDAPIFETSVTNESEEPYRFGRSLIVRYWRDRGFVIGRWEGEFEDEQTALLAGIHGRPDDILDEGGKLLERYKRRAARRKVAEEAKDLDDEWELVNVLALMDDQERL